jgi:hypothetical protein
MSAPILDLKKTAPAAEEQKEEQKGLSNDSLVSIDCSFVSCACDDGGLSGGLAGGGEQ